MNQVGNALDLTIPLGTMFASAIMQEEYRNANKIFVSLNNAEVRAICDTKNTSQKILLQSNAT